MTTESMEIYCRLQTVPAEATKPIGSGKLKGFTNITPQWRYQRLTEVFGPCGFGWKYDAPTFEFMNTPDGTTVVFCSTNLYVKMDGEWSEPIPGEGGNKFAYKTNSGWMDVSDECRKMALTDALSTAAQKLGLAADIYFREGSDSKYAREENGEIISSAPFGTPNTNHDWGNAAYSASAIEKAAYGNRKAQPQPPSPAAQVTTEDLQRTQPAQQHQVQSTSTEEMNNAKAVKITFGRFNGKTVGEVLALNRSYLEWVCKDEKGTVRRFHPELLDACRIVLA